MKLYFTIFIEFILIPFICCLEIKNNNIIWTKRDFDNDKNINLLNNNVINVTYKANIVNDGISKYFKLSKLCNSMILEYKIYFPNNFDFVKGGKLPGLYGGNNDYGCSGCEHSNKCFSARLMWRKNGNGEVYLYSPNQKDLKVKNYNDGSCGLSLGRNNFKFYKNKWINIKEQVLLNNLNNDNGVIKLWINNKLYIENNHIKFQTSNIKNESGIFFSTFFGGSTKDWAPKKDMFILFSKFKYKCEYLNNESNNTYNSNITLNGSMKINIKFIYNIIFLIIVNILFLSI